MACVKAAEYERLPGSFDATLCNDEPYDPYEPNDIARASLVNGGSSAL